MNASFNSAVSAAARAGVARFRVGGNALYMESGRVQFRPRDNEIVAQDFLNF
jgi:hypothetical protein